MKLTYHGPHLEVEVPLDNGAALYARRGGPAVEFPAETAKGLLEQGPDHWKKAGKAAADEPGGES